MEGLSKLWTKLQIIKRGGSLGAKEIKIGMPHRGRLNVLANVMGKPFKAIFSEFFGKTVGAGKDFEGDVKYHLGASSNREFDGNSVHISLTDDKYYSFSTVLIESLNNV